MVEGGEVRWEVRGYLGFFRMVFFMDSGVSFGGLGVLGF